PPPGYANAFGLAARPRPVRGRKEAPCTCAPGTAARQNLVFAGAFENAFTFEKFAQDFGELVAGFLVQRRAGQHDGFFKFGGVGGGFSLLDHGEDFIKTLALADGDDIARPLILEDLLDALDGEALIIEEVTDAAQQHDVLGAVIAPTTAALQRLDRGKTRLPEAKDVLRKI